MAGQRFAKNSFTLKLFSLKKVKKKKEMLGEPFDFYSPPPSENKVKCLKKVRVSGCWSVFCFGMGSLTLTYSHNVYLVSSDTFI